MKITNDRLAAISAVIAKSQDDNASLLACNIIDKENELFASHLIDLKSEEFDAPYSHTPMHGNEIDKFYIQGYYAGFHDIETALFGQEVSK